jgi:hypothetical protein
MINSKSTTKKRIILCLGLSLWFFSSFAQSMATGIVVLRPEGDLMGDKPVWIYADGKKICSVTAGQHTHLNLPAGEHAFYVSFSGRNKLKQNSGAVFIACATDRTNYLLIVSNPANRKSVSCAPIVEGSAEKLLLKSSKRDCTAKQ